MVIGTVRWLWRYPVKSMAGQALDRVFVGHGGLYGDRMYALVERGGREAFPWVTAREQPELLLHRARFRNAERSLAPPNWEAAQKSGLTPLFGEATEMAVDVEVPDGHVFGMEEDGAVERLRGSLPGLPDVRLRRSERALTDCGPVSLVDANFAADMQARLGHEVDPRAFRANIWLDLENGLRLDDLVGRQLRVGSRVELKLMERQGRCVLLTLDPDGGPAHPEWLRDVAHRNAGTAGVLAVAVREGMVERGERVMLDS